MIVEEAPYVVGTGLLFLRMTRAVFRVPRGQIVIAIRPCEMLTQRWCCRFPALDGRRWCDDECRWLNHACCHPRCKGPSLAQPNVVRI